MAVLLIFNKDSWMDIPSYQRPDLTGKENVQRKVMDEGLSLEAQTKKLLLLDMKWEARDRPGDIVEVREDAAPRGKMEKFGFVFVSVPGKKRDYLDYGKMDVLDGDVKTRTPPIIIHKRSYWIDMSGIVPNNKSEASLTIGQFQNRVHRKKEWQLSDIQ